MASFSISLRLTDLVNVLELDLPTKKDGVKKKYVCIPVDENFLYKGKNGTYYLDLTAWENTDKETNKHVQNEFGYTHGIRKNVPMKVKDQLFNTEELRKLTPYCGNMKPLSRKEKPIYPTTDNKRYSDTVDTKAVKKMDIEADLPY